MAATYISVHDTKDVDIKTHTIKSETNPSGFTRWIELRITDKDGNMLLVQAFHDGAASLEVMP